jgi:phosphoribosylanthranilate isomerase
VENVADALAAVRPYAVDVCSGVELAPGRKDAARMRAFVAAVRAWEKKLDAQPLT